MAPSLHRQDVMRFDLYNELTLQPVEERTYSFYRRMIKVERYRWCCMNLKFR
jgi:hypothetical protein